MSLTFVKASCHCGLNTFQASFVKSKLPLAGNLCHCNACRHITGQQAVHCALMEGPPLSADSGPESQKPADLSNLKTYSASQWIIRYSCPNCCAYLIYEIKGASGSHWIMSTGALERTEGVVQVGYHGYVADTLDGGIADHYRVLDGVELPRYSLGGVRSATLPIGWKASIVEKESNQERLAAYCHCGTISLYLTRPDDKDPADTTTWWVTPKKENDTTSRPRLKGVHCVCGSCRRSSGSLITSWVIIARENVVDVHTSLPISFKEGSGKVQGLKQYQSSPGNYRESCGTCGATIFLWSTDPKKAQKLPVVGGEPLVIYIGAGLLDQENGGARAEKWCDWSLAVGFPNDALDKAGMEALTAGVKASI